AERRDEARRLAHRAHQLARERKERAHEAYALRLLGEIDLREGSPTADAAATPFRGALALAVELGLRPLAAHCHLGLGRLYPTIAGAPTMPSGRPCACTARWVCGAEPRRPRRSSRGRPSPDRRFGECPRPREPQLWRPRRARSTGGCQRPVGGLRSNACDPPNV